ncbi:hypothetical protein, partial [Listeria monocytogenes]
MILAHKKTDAEKGVNRIGQKREFGIFILKGGRRMKMFCLLLAYDYILTKFSVDTLAVSYTHLRAHETAAKIVCRLLLEKKKGGGGGGGG